MELIYTRVENARESDEIRDKNFTFKLFFNANNAIPC